MPTTVSPMGACSGDRRQPALEHQVAVARDDGAHGERAAHEPDVVDVFVDHVLDDLVDLAGHLDVIGVEAETLADAVGEQIDPAPAIEPVAYGAAEILLGEFGPVDHHRRGGGTLRSEPGEPAAAAAPVARATLDDHRSDEFALDRPGVVAVDGAL